jgi:hypothetical protein
MARRDLMRRLERLEAAERPAGVRIAVVIDEADAARVSLEHRTAGNPRSLILVCTGVRRAEQP